MIDVAVVGGGMAGMASAARLQAAGLETVVLEAHGAPGGCAGYYTRRGFSFDVGATTLVDFGPDGVGGELLESIGMAPVPAVSLPGYRAWLPDRTLTLHRDPARWAAERRQLGDSPGHARLWALLDRIAAVFWRASRRGVRLPIRSAADLARAMAAVGPGGWALGRYLRWTLGDALRAEGLRDDRPLVGLLAMLVEDTVHASVDRAPLINAALGITIRGAGLGRAQGGMRGFWRRFAAHYRSLGGLLRLSTRVLAIDRTGAGFVVRTSRGELAARRVVSAVPVDVAATFAPGDVRRALAPFLARNREARGGALLVCLGVPEREVAGESFTHHQLLQDYDAPLGNGNNMFVSVSEPGDLDSAPPGHRAVMISTHTELQPWQGLSPAAHEERKRAAGERLIALARRVYPELGRAALVCEVATPVTYARFTGRPQGAVGGFRLSLVNANQRAVPHRLGGGGFWLAGDTTWPGLGTVACVLGSRIVAGDVLAAARRGADAEPATCAAAPRGFGGHRERSERDPRSGEGPERRHVTLPASS